MDGHRGDGKVKRLCQLVAKVLEVEENAVSPETGPMSLPEWDSFKHVQLVVTIEETYGVQLPTEEIVNLFSVKDIAKLLQESGVEIE
jgi:acyl carrier protein